MAAVLRVKRRNDEEPLEALVVACKRRKTVDNDKENDEVGNEPVTAVLKFAGTLKNPGDNVAEHLTKTLTKDELKANFKQHVVNVTTKAREQTKQESQESRFRVVNCFRSLDPTDLHELIDKEMTVIDVEDSTSCSKEAKPTTSEGDDNFVYDLYYTKTEEDMLMDNLLSIHPLQDELVFGTYRDNGLDSDGEIESDDSNSESNWRNDYPDSDHSANSICDEDMRSAVRRMNMDEDSDLSSDDFDENLVYALAEDDVQHFGYKYAKYKARIKAEIENLSPPEDSDSDKDEDLQTEDSPEV